jgi:hypothetical protein
LILANGTIKDITDNTIEDDEQTTTTPAPASVQTKIEVNHGNIDSMMNLMLDNVIQEFDKKLPTLLNEFVDEDEDVETTTDDTKSASHATDISDPEIVNTMTTGEVSDTTGVATENNIDSSVTDPAVTVAIETKDSSETSTTTEATTTTTTTTTTETTTTELVETTTSTTTTTTTAEPSLPSVAEDVVRATSTESTSTESTTSGDATSSTTSTSSVTWDYRTGKFKIRKNSQVLKQ